MESFCARMRQSRMSTQSKFRDFLKRKFPEFEFPYWESPFTERREFPDQNSAQPPISSLSRLDWRLGKTLTSSGHWLGRTTGDSHQTFHIGKVHSLNFGNSRPKTSAQPPISSLSKLDRRLGKTLTEVEFESEDQATCSIEKAKSS